MYKMSKKCYFLLFFFVLLVVFISIIVFIKYKQTNEYKDLAKEYLNLRESNNNQAYDLCYFKPEYTFVKQALIDSGIKILKTDMKKFKKINNNLYVFLIEFELEDTLEMAYSYVANIDGKLYIIINKRDIPDNLKKNYNESEYNLEKSDKILNP